MTAVEAMIYDNKVKKAMGKWGVSWFKFDEASGNVTDSKGSAVGTIVGATRGTGWNDEGKAIKSTEVANTYVQFNDKIIPTGEFSIRFKIKALPSTSKGAYFLNTASSVSNGKKGIFANIQETGKLTFGYWNDTTTSDLVSAESVADDTWKDVLISKFNNKIELYVDEILVSTKETSLTYQHTDNLTLLSMSSWFSTANRTLNGQIDNFQVYNKALTPSDFYFDKTLILHDGEYKKYENRFNEEYTGNAPYYLKMSNTRNTLNNMTVGNGNILFNGINSYIKSSVRVIPKGRKAIRVKVKFNSVGTTAQTIISETNGSDTHGNIIMLNANGNITWASYKAVVGQNRFALTTSTTFVANKWYDMLFTWDGTTSTNALKIYVDNFTTPLIQGTANLVETADNYHTTSIGRFDLGGGQTYLNGEISLLEIYNTIPLANDIINNTTKYTIVKGWKDVSSTLPTQEQFLTEGMDSLSPLLDRKATTLEPQKMFNKSDILPVGSEGKVFSRIVDLSKYLDIRSMKVEVR